ncbi:two-component system, response regulator YcbB [Selenomonas ruminantium]|uniref:Two-component system, response regulator YcbB n=1 Tax=Selenomonas ruminantium TaxID=971 RepID=A0A1I3EES3_SELRU|nr:response regulator [Selenomonas ruminantium]SFH97457.1 two-component system, response regulator YcbB [Selenomonas ruminantium]
MNILLIDDDEAIRMMLQDIIEDYNLGEVVASLPSAAELTNSLLALHHVDILIIDMLMPGIDGIAAVSQIKKDFAGKIIMLSQVESKDLVGKAYEQGVNYYITKPLNRNEIVSIIRNVSEHLRLESFAQNLQSSLASLTPQAMAAPAPAPSPAQKGTAMLQELGIANAPGAQDLLDIINYLTRHPGMNPSLKQLFTNVASERPATSDAAREAKAMEQRLRRTIYQAHVHLATLGAVDYTNPRFEEYAPIYFDYSDIRNTMRLIENDEKPSLSQVHINTKKFIFALYDAITR